MVKSPLAAGNKADGSCVWELENQNNEAVGILWSQEIFCIFVSV